MTGATVANSPLVFILVSLGLLMLVAFALISYAKARKRCLELGVTKKTIAEVVSGSLTFSIVPSVVTMVGLLALSGALGPVWAWWRLSVIGALAYETMAAGYAADGMGVALGEILSSPPSVFGAVMIVMSLGVVCGPIIVSIFAEKYSTGIMKARAGANTWGVVLASCFFLAMFSVYVPVLLFSSVPTAMTLLTSVIVTAALGMLAKKVRGLESLIMAIAMIASMAASVLWVKLFA